MKQLTQNFFTKNTSLRIIICLLLFIPLILAVIFGLRVDPNTVTVNSLLTVTVSSPDGAKSEFTDEETLSLYSSITEDAKEIDSSFRDFSEEQPFRIVFSETNSDPIEYKLYISDNLEGNVFISPDDKYFLVNSKVAQKLISRSELSYVDLSAVLPILKASGFGEPEILSANGYHWSYTANDGNVSSFEASSLETSNPVIKFDISEDSRLKLEFDKMPDSISINVTDSEGSEIFNGKFEDLFNSHFPAYSHDELLNAKVVAEWYPIEDFDYHNTVSYDFKLLYDIEPTYRLVDTKTLPLGEFTVLRMSDFNDGEQITVTNEMGIPEKLNVYDLDEDTKITFIPFGAHLDITKYDITVSTELGQTHDFTVSTKYDNSHPKGFSTQEIIINEETDKALNDAFSKASLEEYDALIKQLTSTSANEMLYDGPFVYPTGDASIAKGGASFGTTRKVYSLNSAGEQYISSGHDLACKEGDEIVAANNGNVVYAGTTALLGNTVIIDHGFGILSVYGNLSNISVTVGDAVTKKSSVIGLAGSTGFACAEGEAAASTKVMCHYAVALNGVFVSPKSVSVGIFF